MIQAFRNVWKSARGAVRRNILKDISDDIASNALSNPSYRNAEEYMNAFMRGRLTTKENGIIVRTLINNVGKTDASILAEALVNNKHFVSSFSKETRTSFKKRLKDNGFNDNAIDSIVDKWIERGLRFNRQITKGFTKEIIKKLNLLAISNPGEFVKTFSKALGTSLPNDPMVIAVKNLSRAQFGKAFKAPFSNNQAKWRTIMFLTTGQKTTFKEYAHIWKNAKGINDNFGTAAAKGLLSTSGHFIGNQLRTWVLLSATLSIINAFIDGVRNFRKEGIEYENAPLALLYLILNNLTISDYSYFIPFWGPWDLWSNLLKGDGEKVKEQVINNIKSIEDTIINETSKEDLFKHLTPSQQNEIGEDVNGNLFYTSPLYPVKKINGVWSVYLPNEGWYDVKDID